MILKSKHKIKRKERKDIKTKNNFLIEYVENAHLDKPVVNKIMIRSN